VSLPLPKTRRCKAQGCREKFTPRNMAHVACGKPECAEAIVLADKAKTKAKAERQAKKATAERKRLNRTQLEELKTLPKLLKEAQREFNRFIRLRDISQPCICCGRPLGNTQVGGGYDAGHYRSVGSAHHLRFNSDNCHAQRKDCNRWGSGRAVDYRLGLIQRIGLARVEALEADQSSPNWTRDDVRAIRDKYRAACRELERG
jgi:hypothetical protein